MSNEEIRKIMEFLIEHQAQFVARVEKNEARLTRLEDAFVTLVELARIADERLDRADERMNKVDERMDRAENTLVTLVELARIADERIDTFDEKMAVILEAQARTDAKLAEIAEAQVHTDERLNALIDVVDRYIRKGNNNTSLN